LLLAETHQTTELAMAHSHGHSSTDGRREEHEYGYLEGSGHDEHGTGEHSPSGHSRSGHKPGGHVLFGTFGSTGPTRCSGLDVRR